MDVSDKPAMRSGDFKKGQTPNWVLQRRLCHAILGKEGTPEYEEFVATTRRHYLAGILPPGITTLLLHYGYGKPVERIEIEDTTQNDMEGLSEEALRDRARRLALSQYAFPAPPPGDDPTVQ